jgi:Growth inhibitor
MERGEVWWAELPDPVASEPGFRRPVVIVSSNAFNRSRIRTVSTVVLTSNLRLSEAPGNVFLAAAESGLPKDSVERVPGRYIGQGIPFRAVWSHPAPGDEGDR